MMKRVLTAILFVMFLSTGAWAAGSWGTFVDSGGGNNEIRTVTLGWTGDASGGTVPDKTFDLGREKVWYLIRAITDPGTTAPTDDYDITVKDAYGNDYANSQLLNRDESTTEKVAFGKYEPIYGTITVSVSDTTVNSATGTIVLVFAR
jgi:hypothetical protein